MIVYHTSNVKVDRPDTEHSRKNLDFGKGFYATVLREQAVSYAKKFLLRGQKAYLNVYQCEIPEGINVKKFEAYDEEWLDFIAACRKGETAYEQYDIIMGGIANDRIFNTVDLYLSGNMTKDEALKRLIYEKPNQQICFTNQHAIDKCIAHVNSLELHL